VEARDDHPSQSKDHAQMLNATVMRYLVTGTTTSGLKVTYDNLDTRWEANRHKALHTWSNVKVKRYFKEVGTHAFA
jgi:hypothetical protein